MFKNLANPRIKIVHFKNDNIFLKSARIKHLLLNYEETKLYTIEKSFYWSGQSCFFSSYIYLFNKVTKKCQK